MHENRTVRPVITILRGRAIHRMREGVTLTKIFVSTFVNITMYPLYNNNMLIKIKKKSANFSYKEPDSKYFSL
jgi:hypothetical protein